MPGPADRRTPRPRRFYQRPVPHERGSRSHTPKDRARHGPCRARKTSGEGRTHCSSWSSPRTARDSASVMRLKIPPPLESACSARLATNAPDACVSRDGRFAGLSCSSRVGSRFDGPGPFAPVRVAVARLLSSDLPRPGVARRGPRDFAFRSFEPEASKSVTRPPRRGRPPVRGVLRLEVMVLSLPALPVASTAGSLGGGTSLRATVGFLPRLEPLPRTERRPVGLARGSTGVISGWKHFWK